MGIIVNQENSALHRKFLKIEFSSDSSWTKCKLRRTLLRLEHQNRTKTADKSSSLQLSENRVFQCAVMDKTRCVSYRAKLCRIH